MNWNSREAGGRLHHLPVPLLAVEGQKTCPANFFIGHSLYG